MRTNKSISNIAYMSPNDFEMAVSRLQDSGDIGTCFWICHRGEGKDKNHIHFILLGGEKTYNTNGLSDLFGFTLFDDGSKGSVTKCWCPTKRVEDWLLYSIHDKKSVKSCFVQKYEKIVSSTLKRGLFIRKSTNFAV